MQRINFIGNYDDLLREALRIALGIDTNPDNDSPDEDFNERYDRIRALMRDYVGSEEGKGMDASMLMTRLAICIIDVIDPETRKGLLANPCTTRTKP
jgi:hypothetical protein